MNQNLSDNSRKGMLQLANRMLKYVKSHSRTTNPVDIRTHHMETKKLFLQMNENVNESEVQFWQGYVDRYSVPNNEDMEIRSEK